MTETVNEPAQVVPPTPPTTPVVEVVKPEAKSDETPDVKSEIPSTSKPADSPADDSEAPKKNRAQDRIEDLVAEKNAAKEYAEYWREKALEIIQQGKAPSTTQSAPTDDQVPDEPPTLEQFGYDQKQWSKAIARWNTVKVRQEVTKTLEQERAQSVQTAATNQFQERVDAFKKDHPDFDTVMANPRLPQLDHISAAMIVGSEHGADISYTLAKNPDLAVKVSRMSPSQQALAVGRIESEIIRSKEAPPVPAEKPKAKTPAAVTNAPEPPTPVPAGGVPSPEPGSMDIREWMKFRVQEARGRRRR